MHNKNCLRGGGSLAPVCLALVYGQIAYGASLFFNLFLLRNSEESVAWVFLHNAVRWQLNWLSLSVLFYFSEKVDGLWFSTTKGYFSAVQVVCNAL